MSEYVIFKAVAPCGCVVAAVAFHRNKPTDHALKEIGGWTLTGWKIEQSPDPVTVTGCKHGTDLAASRDQ